MVNPLADELSSARRAPPCAMVIFGATGDLTHRKLVPALLGLSQDGLLPPSFTVIGLARRPKSDDEWRQELLEQARTHARSTNNVDEAFSRLADAMFYHQSTFEDVKGYERLAQRLAECDKQRGTKGNRLFYLATPPSAYSTILQNLSKSGLAREQPNAFTRIVIEKPFGHDLPTARALNDQVNSVFRESQVYRIDHYLGKETVQNIMVMRFANLIFEPLWNEKYVDHVQITVAEDDGIGGRGAYFEEAGIIRDMIQNHLMQLLTLVGMEPPVSLAADAVRDEKVKVLRAIRSFRPDEVPHATVRGQYVRAFVGGKEVPGFREEEEVAAESRTETYATVRLEVNNWRWARTPFFLRAGKRLPRRVTEIAIVFKRPPQNLFDQSNSRPLESNALLLRIQPDEGVSMRFGSKVPGPDIRIRDVRMDFRYGAAFGGRSADAYERLLLDAMLGDSTLFARRDEVEEAWRITDSIVAGWKGHNLDPLPYAAGSWGPEAAGELLGSGREWRKP